MLRRWDAAVTRRGAPALDLLGEEWVSWTPQQKAHLLQRIRDVQAQRLADAWQPYPWQRPHAHPDGRPPGVCDASCLELPPLPPLEPLDTVLIIGGRGTGKTDGAAHYVLDHVAGPACDPRIKGGHRVAIVAPTIGDAVGSCANGPSGLIHYDPRVQLVGTKEGTIARFPGGARARLFGGSSPHDVDRFRSGGNNCLLWVEEAAAIRHLKEVIAHADYGLRVGPRPHVIASTTPKPRAEVKAWLADPAVHVFRGRTQDAHHLDAGWRKRIVAKYAGTRQGRQELDGELLEDVEGALWTALLIEVGPFDGAGRIHPGDEPDLARIVVAVDPNAGGPDECGIVVVGVSRSRFRNANGDLVPHVYVLEDASGHYPSPGAWARRAVQAYRRWAADAIVAEVNNGGDMVPYTVHTIDPAVRCRSVTATRGKARRAEPVVALYEQGVVHHVGAFPKLEDQMTTWVDEPGADSPDRMDALVWGVTEVAVKPAATMFDVV